MRKMPTKLNAAEREALLGLTYNAGFPVLKKIMETRCQQATIDILEIDPQDPKRAEKIDKLQLVAFVMNRFMGEVFEDMNFNLAGGDEPEPEESELSAA
jgi:hypothetical protein